MSKKLLQHIAMIAAIAMPLADGVAAATAAASAPATQQTQPGEDGPVARQRDAEGRPISSRPSGGGLADVLWTAVALAIVVALIFFARAALKRYAGAAPRTPGTGVLEVLARTPLPPKHQLVLVRLGQRLVLIGTGGEGLAALGEITDPAEVQQVLQLVKQAGSGSGRAVSLFDAARRMGRKSSDKESP